MDFFIGKSSREYSVKAKGKNRFIFIPCRTLYSININKKVITYTPPSS